MIRNRYLHAAADISQDGKYRFSLTRQLQHGTRVVLFIGLNPSTAGALTDDPTVRRCVGFARRWNFDCVLLGNLHALRSTDPKQLVLSPDPSGPSNEASLRDLAGRAELVVAAWGSHWRHPKAEQLARWIVSLPHTKCLGQNRDGCPKHPLYLAGRTRLRKLSHRSPVDVSAALNE